MSKVLLVSVLLAWPMVGFGIDLALLGGPINFDWEADTSLTFDLYLISDEPFRGLQWLLLFEEEAQNNLWTVTHVDATGNESGLSHWYELYNDLSTGATLNEAAEYGAEQWMRSDGSTPAGTYFLCTVTIAPMFSMEPCVGETFTLVIPEHYQVLDMSGNPIGTDTPLAVNIVPEPAGALLLLLAAPFIRRRTA